MRIIWKDTKNPKTYKPIKYRKHYVYGTDKGWITDIEGDNNLYYNHYCAMNAIDAAMGDYTGNRGSAKRKASGIQIVGTYDDQIC